MRKNENPEWPSLNSPNGHGNQLVTATVQERQPDTHLNSQLITPYQEMDWFTRKLEAEPDKLSIVIGLVNCLGVYYIRSDAFNGGQGQGLQLIHWLY